MIGRSIFVLVVTVFLLSVGYFTYRYFNGEDFKLYDEAVILYDEGDIEGAHDKLIEAYNIRKTNRKVLALKTIVYQLLRYKELLIMANEAYEKALGAADRDDYISAAEYVDLALISLDGISEKAENYEEAMELQKKVVSVANEIIEKAPLRYYDKGIIFLKEGEFEKAYYSLTYIGKPSLEVIQLKSDIAYKLGNKQYEKTVNNISEVDLFLVRDAIFWYSKIDESYIDYKDANIKLDKLKNILKDNGNNQ